MNAVLSGNTRGNHSGTVTNCAHRHRRKVLLGHRRCQKRESQKVRGKQERWFFQVCTLVLLHLFVLLLPFFFSFHVAIENKVYTLNVSWASIMKTYQCVNIGLSLHGLFCHPFSGNCQVISLFIKLQKLTLGNTSLANISNSYPERATESKLTEPQRIALVVFKETPMSSRSCPRLAFLYRF